MNLGSKHDMLARKFRVCDFNISLYELQQHKGNKINKDDAIFLMQLYITNDADSKHLYKQIDACEIDGILHNYVNLTMLMDKVEAYIDYLQSVIDWQDRYNSLKDNPNKDYEKAAKKTKEDTIHHPSHYQGAYGLECYDVIKNFSADLSGEMAYYQGNAIKYLLRWQKKNGAEDLKKCKEYIDDMLKNLPDAEEKKTSGRYPWGESDQIRKKREME